MAGWSAPSAYLSTPRHPLAVARIRESNDLPREGGKALPGDLSARAREQRWDRWLLHVLLLAQLAISQPLYAVLGDGAEFFVAHSFAALDLIGFVVALSFVVPLLLGAAVLPLGLLGAAAARTGRLAMVCALAGLTLLPVIGRLGLGSAGAIGLAAVGGGLATLAYARFRGLHAFLDFASIGALLFPVAFLLGTPVRGLLFGAEDAADPGRPHVVFDTVDTPVFLIVFDELSTVALVDGEGRLDAANFPNFARLAERATWFRNASASAISTELAVAAILTGRHPERDRLPLAVDYPVSLFTLVSPEYEVAVFDHLVRLCPESICAASDRPRPKLRAVVRDLIVVYAHIELPRELRERLPPIEGRWTGFTGDSPESSPESREKPFVPFGIDAKRSFEAFIDSIDAGARGRLTFIHSLLPHIPYVFLPDGRRYTLSPQMSRLPGWSLSDNLWNTDPALVAEGYQRALLQTRMVDGLVGRFLDRLEALGLFDDALIVVTADHGVNFVPGVARRGFNDQTLGTGLMVPLFVKRPGRERGELSDRNVEAIDIVPTILGVLGSVPEGLLDGASAFGPGEARARKGPLPYLGPARDLPGNLLPELRAEARHKVSLFQDLAGHPDFYRLASFGDLIGRPVASFELGPERAIAVNLWTAPKLQEADPNAEFLPAYLEGTLDGAATESDLGWLAIAFDGRVAAVSRVFERRGDVRFAALVPPALLISPPKTTAFYSIARDAGGTRVRLFRLRSGR